MVFVDFVIIMLSFYFTDVFSLYLYIIRVYITQLYIILFMCMYERNCSMGEIIECMYLFKPVIIYIYIICICIYIDGAKN